MQKNIGDMAKYIKTLLPADIPASFEIAAIFTSVSDEDSIRRGVKGYLNFMNYLCDVMVDDESVSSIPRKGKEKFSDETTLTVEFPFLNNIKSILVNIGHYGSISGDSIIINSWDTLSLKRSLNKNSTTKISVPQMMKALRFLNQCGLCFQGIDLNVKKPDLSIVESITVTYPEDPMMIAGWKALGLAQSEFATRKNDEILLRCDYRMLGNGDLTSIVEEYTTYLTSSLKDLVKSLHQHYMDSGMVCNVEKGSFCTQLIYSYRKKPIWRFTVSFHNGYRIILKTKYTHKYQDAIETFPDYLKERINKGYGCDRKTGSGHGDCQRGCEGFSFPLDETLLNAYNDLRRWQDHELSSMKR